MHVLQTTTRPKKVTHVVTINGQDTHCTSAAHVCQMLQGLGHNITPAIVYRSCSKDARRVHRTSRLPDTIKITRAAK
jgi:hypothetical protein